MIGKTGLACVFPLREAAVGMAFALAFAFAASVPNGAAAETREVRVDCPQETSKDIDLKGSEDKVNFTIYGCDCSTDPEVLKRNVARGSTTGTQDSYGGIGSAIIEPGDEWKQTLYCLSNGQIRAFLGTVGGAE